MKELSYENLKEREQELERLKGKVYSLEDKVCEIMKEIFKQIESEEAEVKKTNQKRKKRPALD